LVPLETEALTAVTIALIAAILTIYVAVLKKNGWIGKTPNTNQPSSQFRKIFQTQGNSAKNQTPITIETAISAGDGEAKKAEEKADAQETEKRLLVRQKLVEAQRLVEAQKSVKVKNERPRCIHYFGYLNALPRGTEVPGECLLCAKLVECYKEKKIRLQDSKP
jgi:hypothetical protein